MNFDIYKEINREYTSKRENQELEIKTKNIYPSIFVHIFNNGVATAMIFFMDVFGDIIPV